MSQSNDHVFSDAERHALYRTIYSRRDVRGQFTSEPIDEDLLARILMAAHHAPSVGFMQPWSFIVVRAEETKRKVHALFEKAHAEATLMFEGEKRETYRNLKLQGILEAPINLCITCDKDRAGPVVLGRTHIPEMDLYSTVCAVQNLWLAARSEGLGMGWVSILDQQRLKEVLAIPENVQPVAYLCLGHVSHFNDKPELETSGWRKRLPAHELTHFEAFGESADDTYATTLLDRLQAEQARIEKGDF
ncbi:5,6-dimethylbenzimidazole synthase [Magnetovibrio sp.]|uniref:5,6-dimethylbenzimidazole synthase n=1 Tax=Magnetovibrio sp. TaxID=2024836 RepID=UPI002F956036